MNYPISNIAKIMLPIDYLLAEISPPLMPIDYHLSNKSDNDAKVLPFLLKFNA